MRVSAVIHDAGTLRTGGIERGCAGHHGVRRLGNVWKICFGFPKCVFLACCYWCHVTTEKAEGRGRSFGHMKVKAVFKFREQATFAESLVRVCCRVVGLCLFVCCQNNMNPTYGRSELRVYCISSLAIEFFSIDLEIPIHRVFLVSALALRVKDRLGRLHKLHAI